MKQTITPIQTKYNGYYFRSRLEARWAIFFETLRIPYQYEPEGFKLSNGMCYLPDFFLELPFGTCDKCLNAGYWFEIKGGRVSDEDWLKCKLLGKESNHTCILAIGDPIDCSIWKFNRYNDFGYSFDAEYIEGDWVGPWHRSMVFWRWGISEESYNKAAEKARSWRF